MENFQIAGLFLAAIIWAVTLKRFADPGARVLVCGIILLHFNFFLLEFDVRPFHVWWLVFFFKGIFRNSVLVLGWLCVFVLFARQMKPTWNAFIQWLGTRSGKVLLIAGFFWGLGFIVDKSKPFALADHSFMAEELFETNAVFFMIFSAIFFRRSVREFRKVETPPTESTLRPR